MAGSLTIVLHAPEETPITSLLQVWQLAMQPGRQMDCFCYKYDYMLTPGYRLPRHVMHRRTWHSKTALSTKHPVLMQKTSAQSRAHLCFGCRLLAICGGCCGCDPLLHAACSPSIWHHICICVPHHLFFSGLPFSHELQGNQPQAFPPLGSACSLVCISATLFQAS